MKNLLFSITLLLFACSSDAQSVSNSTPEQMNSEFFGLYKSKGANASIKYLFSTNKWIFEIDTQNVISKLTELTSALGNYTGHDFITKKSVGPNFVLYTFLVKYDRQPIRFNLTYYKADTKWQLQFFEYDPDLQTGLREAASTYRLLENFKDDKE